MIGYIILVLVFLGLVVACFIPALLEYFRPKDAGPLKIDMNRNIDERYFSQSFRRMIERAVSLPDSRPNSAKTQPVVFHGVPARWIAADINRGPEEIVEVKGNLSVPANTELAEVLVVRGSLTTGQNCVFKKEILVEGGAKIGARNHLLCLSADFVNLGEQCEVEGWVDANRTILLRRGCLIKSRTTAGEEIIIEDDVMSPRFAAPDVDLGARAAEFDGGYISALTDEAEIDWTPELDAYLRARFETDSLEEIRRAVIVKFQIIIPEIMLLRRAGLLGLIQDSLFKIDANRKPAYMRSSTVWLQGGETARIKGSIDIPDGEVVPFNLIVVGNLKSGEHVVFQGGVHVTGNVKIGKANRLWKSLVGARDIFLGDYTIVENCVDADRNIVAGREVKVGRGLDGGGMSAGGRVTLAAGFKGHHKAFADEGVVTGTGAK